MNRLTSNSMILQLVLSLTFLVSCSPANQAHSEISSAQIVSSEFHTASSKTEGPAAIQSEASNANLPSDSLSEGDASDSSGPFSPSEGMPSIHVVNAFAKEGYHSYMLSSSETENFMNLFRKITFKDSSKKQFHPESRSDYVNPPGAMTSSSYFTMDYGTHQDHLILPQFILNGEAKLATDGAREFIEYINTLKPYQESNINLFHPTPDEYYAIGREDGVFSIELRTMGDDGYFLPEEEYDTFLSLLNQVRFTKTGEKLNTDEIKTESYAVIIIVYSAAADHPTTTYLVSPQWGIYENAHTIFGGDACEAEGDTEALLSYLSSLDYFHNLQ